MSQIAGSTVLITGGGMGIGRLMALKMAALGARIVIWDINPDNLANVTEELNRAGREVFGYQVDVSDREKVYDAAKRTLDEAGPVQILINNAGIVSGKPFIECSDEQIERTMNVNTMALFWVTKAFLPQMMENGWGHLVTISSAGGILGTPGLADYSASKFAAFGFDEALRGEFKKRGLAIKTTVVCPFFIDTGMFEGVKTKYPLLLPILREGYVANRIIGAIQRNRARIWMPPIVYTVPLLRALPVPLMDWIAKFLGVTESMDEFKGRAGNGGQK
jgi:all-trans-retinol dehydrogenase (NAD+)